MSRGFEARPGGAFVFVSAFGIKTTGAGDAAAEMNCCNLLRRSASLGYWSATKASGLSATARAAKQS
jgi:hypothetical protein